MGVAALSVLSIPLLSAKGGNVHVRAGWFYVVMMIGVGLTSFVITPWRAFFDSERTSSTQASAFFLFFIAAFTLSSLWYGLIVLKFKGRTSPSRALSHILPPMILVLLGLATQIFGFFFGNWLLLIFPLLAHTTAKMQLNYWLNTPTTKRHWWYAHMEGMVIASIATLTAFLVTAVPRMSTHPIAHSPVIWIAPGIVGGIFLSRWKQFYRAKFSD